MTRQTLKWNLKWKREKERKIKTYLESFRSPRWLVVLSMGNETKGTEAGSIEVKK